MSKKTLLSRDTVLLRGGGRTNIEYSAGPNINITDDVISGRDWTNAINEAVESAISGIPTPVEYSAGPNIDITDHVVSGKDWTEDIDSHIASATSGLATSADVYSAVTAISGDVVPWITGTKEITTHYLQWGEALTAFSSYDLSGTKNHHIHMKGVAYVMPNVNELTSGFLPLSAFNNFVSSYTNTVNDLYTVKLPWNAVQGDSATSSITGIGGSALSGMGGGGGSCPWISGGKDYGSATEQLQFGSVIPVFSSWGLSGDHNHYIWMKGAYIRLPDIEPYLSSYLDLSSFSSYTASTYNWLSSVNALANSAYTTAVNNYHNKLDISAWSAFTAAADTTEYSAGNGIDITNHVISFTGSEGHEYSAGDNINITDNVISGKDWTNGIASAVSSVSSFLNTEKLDTSSFTSYTASHSGDDNQAYSAGQNINVTNHVISGKDWTNEINGATSGKVNESTFTAYTAAHSGDDNQAYSAGSNINITNHVVSGKSWQNEINAATSGKLDSSAFSSVSGNFITAHQSLSALMSSDKLEYDGNGRISAYDGSAFGFSLNTKPLVAGDGIEIEEQLNSVIISTDVVPSDIVSATSGKLDTSTFTSYTAAHASDDNTPYSAGANINVTDHVISGKDWNMEITSAVESATSGKQDTLTFQYSETNKISGINGSALAGDALDNVPLCAGPGITLTDDSSAVWISAAGNSVSYEYSSPASAFTSYGDLSIRFATSQSTPARTNVWVGDHNVGLLPPCAVNANSFLMQDYRGSLQWVDASAVVPSSMSAQASYFSKTYTSADSGDTSINDYPAMNRDWTFNIINWKDSPIYYSAAQGTATLAPGMGVRVHYDLDSNWLDAEPEYSAGNVGTKYLTDVDIQFVSNSAYATESGVLYIITGSN